MLRHFAIAVSVVLCGAAQSAEAPPAMIAFVETEVIPWVSSPDIVAAIVAQNADNTGLSDADILSQDERWRGEIGGASTPTIDGVMTHPLSAMLKQKVAASEGRITEAFVMDGLGLNVGSSAVTSDLWQGDEAKFKNSFGKGAGAIFVDEVDFDESTQTYQGQVSIAIADPATGQVIGAITVGLDASAFF